MIPTSIYKSLRAFIRQSTRLYHRELVVLHEDRVPLSGPVIFAPNHINGLLDALIVALGNPRIMTFLAKGDLFNGPGGKILPYLNMIPIYRKNENKNARHLNKEIFSACIEILRQGHVFMIFPEGMHQNYNYLKAIKRGLAVIAFQSLEKHPEIRLYVQPTGLYYSGPQQWGNDLLCTYAEPILINDYWPQYQEDKRAAVNAVMEEVEKRILANMVHICDIENYEFWERLSELYTSATLRKQGLPDKLLNRFKIKQTFAQAIPAIKGSDQFEQIRSSFKSLDAAVDASAIPDIDLWQPPASVSSLKFGVFFRSLLLGPLLIPAALLNAPLLTIPSWWVKKKVKRLRFYGTTRMMFRTVIAFLWYPFLALLVLIFTRSILSALAMLFFLYFSARLLHWHCLFLNKADEALARSRWHQQNQDRLPKLRSLQDQTLSLIEEVLD